MRFFVTGAAGFIGSNLVDRLLENGHEVIGYDNFSTGFKEFLINANKSPRFTLVEGDTLEPVKVIKAAKECDFVFHLAANADVRFGLKHPEKDLQQNIIATFNVLEAMRSNGIKKIVFPSTGSIYGEAKIIPTPESEPFPAQTSLYGATKLAGEGLIEAYCEGFGFQAWIFRFVSILGERYTHGHVLDFYKKLLENPAELTVLGNGGQKKSYLYVQDCLDAILFAINTFKGNVNILNLGTNEYCQVNDSIGWITAHLGLHPKLRYTGGDRGWVGDNPFIFLDTAKINNAGWKPKLTIKEAIIRTLEYLKSNKWILEKRG
ncbi:MAG: NAD-dependent epimerase/dehydratase family protein [Candidatus Omnitrophica bacterium]|nr:NAD-dependent epimerase/dehydratase family protein [Candidatus Omnitrophota bacterium]